MQEVVLTFYLLESALFHFLVNVIPCYRSTKAYLMVSNSLTLESWKVRSSRLLPRYQPIWTIYIPFESPWLIDFRNARIDLNFWCYIMPCGATLCKFVFSGGIAAWEQRHTRKTIRLKIFPNLLFYQFISKLFAWRSTRGGTDNWPGTEVRIIATGYWPG